MTTTMPSLRWVALCASCLLAACTIAEMRAENDRREQQVQIKESDLQREQQAQAQLQVERQRLLADLKTRELTVSELKQRLAEIKDRYPSVISEVRGEGLLVGVRGNAPAGELVDALRAEKMIAVAAGDNVVRLLPPLIISEQEIAEGIARLDRACARLSRAREAASKETAAR